MDFVLRPHDVVMIGICGYASGRNSEPTHGPFYSAGRLERISMPMGIIRRPLPVEPTARIKHTTAPQKVCRVPRTRR